MNPSAEPPRIIRASTRDDLRPGPKHRALLFDWDGTVADSQLANFLSIRGALEEHGLSLDQDWFDARTGVSTREMVRMVADAAGHASADVDAIARRRDELFLTRSHQVGEVEAVTSILRANHGAMPTALATGGGRDTVGVTLDALGLRSLFDAIVTREDVEHGKPAPDIFLLAAARLGAPPEGCLVYEDSDEGVEAAGAAGMDVIDVRPLR